jgi:hypothetical protein
MNKHDDPGVGQGRNASNDPEFNRDVLKSTLFLIGTWLGAALILWCMYQAAQT